MLFDCHVVSEKKCLEIVKSVKCPVLFFTLHHDLLYETPYDPIYVHKLPPFHHHYGHIKLLERPTEHIWDQLDITVSPQLLPQSIGSQSSNLNYLRPLFWYKINTINTD